MRRSLALSVFVLLSCTTEAANDRTTDDASTGAVTTGGSTSPTTAASAPDTSNPGSTGSEGSTTASGSDDIVPGVGIGPIVIGGRWGEFEALLGEPDSSLRFGNLLFTTFDGPGLEILLAAPPSDTIAPEASVLSLAARSSSGYGGVVTPGDVRSDVELALGAPSEVLGEVAFYAAGVSIRYTDDDVAEIVGVFAPYTLRTTPPPMVPFEASR